MKKLSLIAVLSLSLTACAKLAMPTLTNTATANAIAQVSANLSDKEFGEHILKEVYLNAVYDKKEGLWKVVSGDIEHYVDYDLKDIQTSNGEKRYLALNYSLSLSRSFNEELRLYTFKKSLNGWELENQEYINGDVDALNKHPLFKDEDKYLGNAKVVQLGKEALGFQLYFADGGSGGMNSDIRWIYVVDNKMKAITGCYSEEWRWNPMSVECKPKIRSNLKSIDGFYPIELNYKITKHTVGDNSLSGAEQWNARKKIGAHSGVVRVDFNHQTQAYELPTDFKEISYDHDKLWQYFNSATTSKKSK